MMDNLHKNLYIMNSVKSNFSFKPFYFSPSIMHKQSTLSSLFLNVTGVQLHYDTEKILVIFQHLLQGLGAWATAAASTRLRQDSTLIKFMLRYFRSRTRRGCDHSGLREQHTPPDIPAHSTAGTTPSHGSTPSALFC